MADLYVALLHHPVYDRHGQIVTTALTNIDVHDIARSCRTFGVRAFYVVTPIDSHRALARRVVRHWQTGVGGDYNPTRREALDLVHLERSLEGVEIDIERACGALPRLVVTSARRLSETIDYVALRAEIATSSAPFLLLLGTGSGLASEVVEKAQYRLAPIEGIDGYNHLSVRGAAAILLDRLAGKR